MYHLLKKIGLRIQTLYIYQTSMLFDILKKSQKNEKVILFF